MESLKMPDERRHNFRVKTQLPVTCHGLDASGVLGASFRGTLLDISANGASLRIDEAVKVPRRMCVRLHVGDPELDLLVSARVASVRRERELRCGLRSEGM